MFLRTSFLVALLCVVALANPVADVTATGTGVVTVSPTVITVTFSMALDGKTDYSSYMAAIYDANLLPFLNNPALNKTVFVICNAEFDLIKAKLNFDKALIKKFLQCLIFDLKYTKEELSYVAELLKQAAAGTASQVTAVINNGLQVVTSSINQIQQGLTNSANQAQQAATQVSAQVVASVQQKLHDSGRAIGGIIRNLQNTTTAVKSYSDNAVTVAGGTIESSIEAGNCFIHFIVGAVPPFPATPQTLAALLASKSAAAAQLVDAIRTKLPDVYRLLTDPNGQFTFIIPTPEEIQAAISKSASDLSALLAPRMLQGRYTLEDLKHATSAISFIGTTIQITYSASNTLTVGGITISTDSYFNMVATNGIAHQEQQPQPATATN